MRATILLFVLALAGAAHAQHDHDAPAKIVGKAKDPQRGVMVMPAPKNGETMEHAMATALPVGNGAPTSSQYGAWFVPPVTGGYVFPQTSLVDGKRRPVFMSQTAAKETVGLIAGRAYRLWPWKGPLIWIPPGGVQGKVPPEYLLPVNPANVMPKKQ